MGHKDVCHPNAVQAVAVVEARAGVTLQGPDTASRLGFSELRPLHVATKPPRKQGPAWVRPQRQELRGAAC